MATGVENSLVGFELLLKTAVGSDAVPLFFDEGPRLFQIPFQRLHDIGYDRGCRARNA